MMIMMDWPSISAVESLGVELVGSSRELLWIAQGGRGGDGDNRYLLLFPTYHFSM